MGTTQPIRKEDELYSFRMYYADEKPNVRNYTLIVLGLNTALRIGDLLSLKWSSVYNFQFQSFYDHICRLPRLLTQQGLTTIERVDDAG